MNSPNEKSNIVCRGTTCRAPTLLFEFAELAKSEQGELYIYPTIHQKEPLMFTRSTLSPTFDNPKECWFLFQENNLLLSEDFALPTLTKEQVEEITNQEIHYLGEWGGASVYAVSVPEGNEPPAGYSFLSFREFYKQFDDEMFTVASSASQVCRWDREHQFCGRCGTPTKTAHNERGKKCPECGTMAFPHVAPAVIVAIRKGDTVLMAQNAKWRSSGLFSSLAGFVEGGESAEDAVHREVYEEVGIKLKNVRYVNSQSWPFPGSLMLGFAAEWESGELNPDGDEIVEAGWYAKEEMPGFIPNRKTISRWILEEALGPIDRE